MAITKEKIVDKVEIVGNYNSLQVRYAWVIKEDGKEIARKFEREAIDCGHITGDDNTWVDTDVSAKDDKVKNIAGVVWTSTEKDALKAALIAAKG
jgi:hypothetical protein